VETKTRLKKIADESGGMGTGYSAVPVLFGNPEEIVDNKDEITKKTYGPSISQQWLFEQPIDYAEHQLMSSNKRSRLKK
jgi:hypothetical protein